MKFGLWVAMTMLINGWAFGQRVIGIWHDPFVPKGAGHSDPKQMSTLLQRRGFKTMLLSSNDLANPQILMPQKIAIVILPYGSYFPFKAVDNFRRYLRAGGRFVSLGGYAFDETRDFDGTKDIGHGTWKGEAPDKVRSQRESGYGRWSNWKWEKIAHEKVKVNITPECIRIVVPDDAPVDWHRVRAFVQLRSGWRYLLAGKVRTEGIVSGYGAYLAADYFDANDNRISFQQTQIVKRTDGWQELGFVLIIPKEAKKVAINTIVHGHGSAEFSEIDVKPIINARWGDARDAMHIDPDQFAIFDPSFRIDGATVLKWREGQGTQGKGKDISVRTKEPMKGYAAVGLVGSNDPVNPKAWSRFVPTLIAYDKFGRYLGPAFSVMYHFAGPYAGSTWSFCGVENLDLTKLPQFQQVLVQVISQMLHGVYLHSLRPLLWTYRRGETAQISVKVRNDGVAPKKVTVRMEVSPMPEPLKMGKPIVVGEKTVTLSPREQATVTMHWRIPQNAAPLYAVRAWLSGELSLTKTELPSSSLDEIWSGFCVWDERVFQGSIPVAWQNNALCELDASGKVWQPKLWLGTNQTGTVFAPEATWENPLQWEFEFALMRKMGLKVLRVLHISHFAGDLENPHEDFWRRYDALVLLAHRHGLVLMPTLHEWMGVSVSDETLRKQCAFVRLVGARYKNAPRIVWDIENEAWVEFRDHPDLHRLFRDWLKRRYGSDEKLQQAWREDVNLVKARYSEHKPRGWDDLKFRDIQHFRRWLVERWVKANVQALRESGAKQPVTDEIDWKVCGDHYEATKWLDFVNLHYYGDRSTNAMATYLKFHDRHARGQGLAIGEFGARNHPSFRFGGWGYASTEEVIRHFVNMSLLTYGLQGAMVLNWDWKDMEACLFPWGLVHQHGIHAAPQGKAHKVRKSGERGSATGAKTWEVEAVLKVSGKTFTAVAKFLDQVASIALGEPRKVAVVIPDEHLLGLEGEVRWSGLGPAGRISAAVFNAIEGLMRLKVPFFVVREWEWKETIGAADKTTEEKQDRVGYSPPLPEIALFPVPFVWSDDTYETVKRYVEQGGIAIITGDFTFDPDRKRTKTERLSDLLALEFVSGVPSPFELDEEGTSHSQKVRCVATDDKFGLQEWWGKPCMRLEQGARGTRYGMKAQIFAMTEKGDPLVVARKLGKGLVVFSVDAPEFRSVGETVKVYCALLKRAAELAIKPERVEWVLGGWVRFGKELDTLSFGQAGSQGWVFVAANLSDKAQSVHLSAQDKLSRLTLSPRWVGFLRLGTHGEAVASLFTGELLGVGPEYQSRVLAYSDSPVMVLGERPFIWIGTLPMHFIPLGAGKVSLFCTEPLATLTVCDLVKGKVLLRRKVQAKNRWLHFDVPSDLVLTEWRVER